MNIPITQSKAWQKLQDDLGETSFFVENPDLRIIMNPVEYDLYKDL